MILVENSGNNYYYHDEKTNESTLKKMILNLPLRAFEFGKVVSVLELNLSGEEG